VLPQSLENHDLAGIRVHLRAIRRIEGVLFASAHRHLDHGVEILYPLSSLLIDLPL
jgi:hypothetical protein